MSLKKSRIVILPAVLIICQLCSSPALAQVGSADFTNNYDVAKGYYDRQQYDSAITFFNKALQANPASGSGNWYRGLCYFHTDRYSQAIPDFDRAIKAYPGSSAELSTLYYLKGKCYGETGDYEKGIRYEKVATAYNGNNGGAYWYSGYCYEKTQDYKTAISQYEKALPFYTKEDLSGLYNNICKCYNDLDAYESALEYAQKAINIDTSNINAYDEQAYIYTDMDDYTTGLRLFKKLVERCIRDSAKVPMNYQYGISITTDHDTTLYYDTHKTFIGFVLNKEANCYYKLGKADSDLYTVNLALKYVPHCITSYYYKGRAYYSMNRYDSAFKYFRIALHFRKQLDNRQGSDMQRDMGFYYLNKNDFDSAYSYFQNSLTTWDYHFYDAQYNFARLNAYMGKYETSNEYYEAYVKSRDDGSDKATIYCNMGLNYLNMGKYKDAMKMYKKATKESPSFRNPYIQEAYIDYYKFGKKSRAIREADKAAQVDSLKGYSTAFDKVLHGDTVSASAILEAYLTRDAALFYKREPSKTAKKIDSVNAAYAFYNASGVYALMGNEPKAIECLDLAIKYGFAEYVLIPIREDYESIKNSPAFVALRQKYRF